MGPRGLQLSALKDILENRGPLQHLCLAGFVGNGLFDTLLAVAHRPVCGHLSVQRPIAISEEQLRRNWEINICRYGLRIERGTEALTRRLELLALVFAEYTRPGSSAAHARGLH